MKITLVAAIASNNVIGKENSLPWNIPEDLKRFKQLTSGHTILMGRKTFDSIGRPLPNRQNIVMTKDKNFEQEGIKVVNDFDEALELIKESNEDVFVIGGSKIYELFYLALIVGNSLIGQFLYPVLYLINFHYRPVVSLT